MPLQSDVRVTIRVDREIKMRAEALFARLGMNMTSALNVFLCKAVDEEGIPFQVSAKKAVVARKYTDSMVTAAFEAAVREDVIGYGLKGHPVARYDADSRRAYLEFPDGAREYVAE